MAGDICALGEPRASMLSALEPGGVVLSGSVGQGGRNLFSDVQLVQGLLNVAGSFASAGKPPLKIDGLVGPLTIATISRFQSATLRFADGRIDPHGPTLARLNVLTPLPILAKAKTGSAQAFVGAPPAAPDPVRSMAPVEAAIATIPQARLWQTLALAHIKSLEAGLILSGGIVLFPQVFNIANTHFHLDRDPGQIILNCQKIGLIFQRIGRMMDEPSRHFREGPETQKSKWADAKTGGFLNNGPTEVVTFRTRFPLVGPMCRAAMMIHEGAHYCGSKGEIIHFAHEFPTPNGEPQDDGTNDYASMPTAEAIRNAASYAAFAIHVSFGTDERFGLDRQNI